MKEVVKEVDISLRTAWGHKNSGVPYPAQPQSIASLLHYVIEEHTGPVSGIKFDLKNPGVYI